MTMTMTITMVFRMWRLRKLHLASILIMYKREKNKLKYRFENTQKIMVDIIIFAQRWKFSHEFINNFGSRASFAV